MYARPEATDADIRALIAPFEALEGPLLPMLHAVQAAHGHIPEAAVGVLADVLNLTRAEIWGVITFYHDFRKQPAGRHVIRICRAEACQAMGANGLSARALARLGVDWHGTTADGAITVEPVFCLGLCASAPAAMVDGRLIGRLDAARVDAMLEELGA